MKDKGFSWNLLNQERSALMGVAMLWIMFFHATFWLPEGFPLCRVYNYIKGLGNIGVDIFLLLSGIGLYYSFQNCRGNVWQFYKKRLKRLLPTVLLCLTPWFIYKAAQTPTNAGRFLLDITALSFWKDGQNPGWFVAELWVAYGIYPLIARSMKHKRRLAFALWVTGIVLVNGVIALLWPVWYSQVEIALTRNVVFVCGCFLAPYTQDKQPWSYSKLALCGAIAAVLLALVWVYPSGFFGHFVLTRYGYCILAIMLSILFSWLLRLIEKTKLVALFRWVGQYTLEMYLIHTQVLRVMETYLWELLYSNLLLNLLALAAAVLLAVAVHKLVGYGEKKLH
jgi:peptidoglycan/LPS O-acetylase OafA/YrhL